MKTGRPSEFTEEIADEICDRISSGESLRRICSDEGMPSKTSVFRWLYNNKEFCFQYARAREVQADSLADEILDICDDGSNDTYTDEEGNVRVNTDVIARSRLRVDTRKWIASKLKPRVYGEKIQQELTGANGGPVQHTITREILDPKESE